MEILTILDSSLQNFSIACYSTKSCSLENVSMLLYKMVTICFLTWGYVVLSFCTGIKVKKCNHIFAL